ncbi:MAG: radical SAM protein, partial [Calditrichaeota bacterium]|nr:radical SAM protein [Calditrichota bacterium]
VELVIEQFRILSDHSKADHLWLTDDIFGLNPHWLTQFANQIEQKQIVIPYTIQSRAGLMNEQTVFDLKRSGCETVWMGVESGSQKILDAMDKETTVEEIIAANQLLKDYGIKSAFFLQYGYPGEDFSDIRKTLRLLRQCLPDTIGISVSYPLKGTIFYERTVESMREKLNWTDSGDLDLMFPGKYHPNFYRALHRFTHHYFAIISLFKKQAPKQRVRRVFSMVKHLPAYVYKRLLMTYYLQLTK